MWLDVLSSKKCNTFLNFFLLFLVPIFISFHFMEGYLDFSSCEAGEVMTNVWQLSTSCWIMLFNWVWILLMLQQGEMCRADPWDVPRTSQELIIPLKRALWLVQMEHVTSSLLNEVCGDYYIFRNWEFL